MNIKIEGEELLDAVVDVKGRINIPRKYAGRRVKVILTSHKPEPEDEKK